MQTVPELDPTEAEDRELMFRLTKQEPSALNALHRRYRTVLKSIVMQVVHDDADAEDVLQDVFCQVWDRAQSYSADKGRLLSWLATLARRRAIDRVRQQSAYRRATDRYEVVCNHPDKDVDETHPVESLAHREDLKILIDRQMSALPIPQQEVLRLTFYEGRSQREIASLTGTPLGTVKTRIELGIKKLGAAIGGMREKIL